MRMIRAMPSQRSTIIPDKGEFEENFGHLTKKLSEYHVVLGYWEQDSYKLQNTIRPDQKFIILVLGRNASDFSTKVRKSVRL